MEVEALLVLAIVIASALDRHFIVITANADDIVEQLSKGIAYAFEFLDRDNFPFILDAMDSFYHHSKRPDPYAGLAGSLSPLL